MRQTIAWWGANEINSLGCSLDLALTQRLQKLSLMGVFVQEEVIAGGICGDAEWQITCLCGVCVD